MTSLVLLTSAPVVAGPAQGQWTYADWEALPDDGNRYEIINGVLYMTTAPSSFHQWIVLSLAQYLGIPAKEQRLAYAFPAPVGVLMPGCDPVQPDFVVVLRQNATIIYDGRIRGVPDLIIEILSPNNRAYDERVKLATYAQAGVPEYAIIDPRARTLSHYRLQSPGRYVGPTTFDETQTVTFDCLPTIALLIAQIFADAPDTTL